MKKISYILISGCITLLSLASCDETFDTSNTSAGILSLSESGLNILQSYNVGEKYDADLWIQHGGLDLNSGSVTFTVDKSLLDSLNTADGTAYQMLPEDCYEMTKTTVEVSANDRIAKGTITYDPTKIHALCGYDKVQYILPLRASSTGEQLNPERSSILLGFNVSEPIVTIMGAGVQEININNIKEVPITVGVPFTNKWNITCNLVNNESLVDTYNSANQTYFTLLPAESYTVPESPTLTQGVSQATVSYKLKDNMLPGNYMLPVQIGEVISDATIRADKETYSAFCIIKEGQKIAKSNWEIVSFTTQETSGEGAGNGLAKCLIDGDTETFWHAKWQGGSTPLPYDIVIDMKQDIQIAQVELLPRGRGSNNPIKVVEFAASEDNVNWTPIGRFGFTNQDAALEYYVKSIKARYIKLTIPDDGGNSTVAAIRELDVKGTIIN